MAQQEFDKGELEREPPHESSMAAAGLLMATVYGILIGLFISGALSTAGAGLLAAIVGLYCGWKVRGIY